MYLNLNLKKYSMNFHRNCWEYYLHYPQHSCQFLAKSIENFCFYINLEQFFKEFWTYIHRVIAVTVKRVKWAKSRFKRKKAFRNDLKMKKKIIEISLFVTEICPKNHQILGDFSFFPYNKLTGIETDNIPPFVHA